jgi:hypothetical protein
MFPRYSWNINQSASLSGPLHVSLAVLVVNVPAVVRHSQESVQQTQICARKPNKASACPFQLLCFSGARFGDNVGASDPRRSPSCATHAMRAYGLTAECKAQDPAEGGGPNASLTIITRVPEYHHHVEGHEKRRFRLELQFPRRSTSVDK